MRKEKTDKDPLSVGLGVVGFPLGIAFGLTIVLGGVTLLADFNVANKPPNEETLADRRIRTFMNSLDYGIYTGFATWVVAGLVWLGDKVM